MKLFDLLNILDTDETVIIRRADDMIVYCGKLINATMELDEKIVNTAIVRKAFIGFGGLVVEINAE